jgi:transposase InsO family protein
MKQDYPKCGIGLLCRLFGKTRHAYYDALWRKEGVPVKEDVILQEVLALRRDLPGLGTRKLHHLLQPCLASHGIRIGRDCLFDLLQEHGLLVRRRKRKAITTDSRHWMRKYGNLVRGVAVTGPEQVWVSDITYIRMGSQWGYLSLITDAYSRKIVGYCFRSDLMAEGCIEALQMAIGNRMYDGPAIHHSDRGSQYCSHQYVNLLHQNGIAISMTENGDPYENALAERVNGIIKTEFNLHGSLLGFEQTYGRIRKSIRAYNEMRPHASCDYLTPEQAHLQSGPLAKRWKNYKGKTAKEQPV